MRGINPPIRIRVSKENLSSTLLSVEMDIHESILKTVAPLLLLSLAAITSLAEERPSIADSIRKRATIVTETPGLVAFWDFVKRESHVQRRFTAHVPAGSTTHYPLNTANYVREYWGTGREATYNDFPQMGRGPFGNAIRIVKETDGNFRPFLFVPRSRLHDTPLDIKGAGKSVTVVVWAIRESGNHALAGIWHEGTDLTQAQTASILKVERGQRQYALFAGLNKPGSAFGHVSENGASSFLNRYALHKCNSADLSPEVPADSPTDVLDNSWQCFAMTFDHEKDELTGWLNGVSGDRWIDNPKSDKLISFAHNAYMQGHYAKLPGKQDGEDETFPRDQYYKPPEDEPLTVRVLRESTEERIELREYRFTKIMVTMGGGKEVGRDLIALRLNPWWYPHDLYAPKDAQSGGPFTIGRVIHSARSVGFTGGIGGVAVFNRALGKSELSRLAAIIHDAPLSVTGDRGLGTEANRVAGSNELPAPAPPDVRGRTGRFRSDTDLRSVVKQDPMSPACRPRFMRLGLAHPGLQ